MILKKCNALVSWLVMLLLLMHGYMAFAILMGQKVNFAVWGTVSTITSCAVGVHVLLVLIIIFFRHDGTNMSHYSRLNARTIWQRVTGLVMLVMLHPHIMVMEWIRQPGPLPAYGGILIIVLDVVFFACLFTHITLSFGNSLITLGLLRSTKVRKRIDMTLAVLSLLAMVAMMIALINHFVVMT